MQFYAKYQVAQPFPVTERVLAGFVAHLHEAQLAPGTVKSYLAAVGHMQIALGLGDPNIGAMPKLEYVVKGLKRTHQPYTPHTCLPITLAILRDLQVIWEKQPDRQDASMLWAAACMCFLASFRQGRL